MKTNSTADADNYDTGRLEKALADIFCGELGRTLAAQAAEFMINHKLNGGMEIFNQRKKDSRLKALFDNDLKANSMPDCRWAKLSLQDLLGSVFQRPLRYPLLLERLLKDTPKDTPAHIHLEKALQGAKEIGNQINKDMGRAVQDRRLKEIIEKTDWYGHYQSQQGSRDILNSISNSVLIHDGPLLWRITKTKVIEVLLVLTHSMLIVLTKEERSGYKWALKKHANQTNKRQHTVPQKYDVLIRMDDLQCKDVAIDPTAFFLVSNSQEIFYEFAAAAPSEAKFWSESIQKAIDEYQRLNPSLANSALSKSSSRLQDRTKTESMGSNSNLSATPPASLRNRPLPQPPTEPPASEPPPPPPPPPPPVKPAGTIQKVTQLDEMVEFNEVKIVNNEPKQFFAGGIQRTDSQDNQGVYNERWKLIADQVSALKSEITDLMTICDLDRHNDSDVASLKHRLVTDLVEIAIKVDHNNRPTIEPFETLIGKVQTYLQTLNSDNTSPNASLNPFTEGPKIALVEGSGSAFRTEEVVLTADALPDSLEDDQRSARSARSASGSSSKSQDEMIEELAQLNISDFSTTAKPPSKVTNTSSSSVSSSLANTSITSATTTSSFETFSSTVVSTEVTTSATKLTASSSLNPFDAVPQLPSSAAPFSDAAAVAVSDSSNPFTSTTATIFEQSVPIHSATHISASSSSVVSSSSTTIITTDLYEVSTNSSLTTASATVFDSLIGLEGGHHLVDDTIDLNDVIPPLPSIPPPQSGAQMNTSTLENHSTDSTIAKASTEAPKSEMFTL